MNIENTTKEKQSVIYVNKATPIKGVAY